MLQRLAAAYVFSTLHGCGQVSTQQQDTVLDMKVKATCGNCEVCEVVIDGGGTETVNTRKVEVDEPPASSYGFDPR